MGGPLQWNFYVIISKEAVEKSITGLSDEKEIKEEIDKLINEIHLNETYTRKFVCPEKDIDSFIENRFPDLKEQMGKVQIVSDSSWEKTLMKVHKVREEFKDKIVDMQPSWWRDLDEMDSLSNMDKLRASAINNPELHVLFYTHIQHEISLAKKKFYIFDPVVQAEIT